MQIQWEYDHILSRKTNKYKFMKIHMYTNLLKFSESSTKYRVKKVLKLKSNERGTLSVTTLWCMVNYMGSRGVGVPSPNFTPLSFFGNLFY